MTAHRRSRRSFLCCAVVAVATLVIAGCGRERAANATPSAPTSADAGVFPIGDMAGAAQFTPAADERNPFETDPSAAAEGKRLFEQMNCAGCHNYSLAGGMGPDLADRYWRYGGTPAAIYHSIAEGRPQGMPAWFKALPPRDIWLIVSYIESYGGTIAPSTSHAAAQGAAAQEPDPHP